MTIKINDLSIFESIDDKQANGVGGGGEPSNCKEYYEQRNQRGRAALGLAQGTATLSLFAHTEI